VNNFLVPAKNVYAAIQNINALVSAMAHGTNTSEHLQEVGVSARGGGGTTAAGSVRRGYILIEPYMSHRFDHAHDIGSKSTRPERVDGYDPNLIHYIVKDIRVLFLHDGVKKILLIGRYGVRITNPWCQRPPHHPMKEGLQSEEESHQSSEHRSHCPRHTSSPSLE
jgi:hypothetical protein